MDHTLASTRPLSASSIVATPPRRSVGWRRRLRRALVIDFEALDLVDLGPRDAFEAEIAALFTRGTHAQA